LLKFSPSFDFLPMGSFVAVALMKGRGQNGCIYMSLC
jgi:hypothetical protein